MAVSASMVKALREKTGAGMMDCKKALEDTGGDEEKAVSWLREKGLAKAQKKAGRSTSEGLIAFAGSEDGKSGALFELKCETDFVAKNENFSALAREVAGQVLSSGSEELDPSVEEKIKELVGVLGENMQPGRSRYLRVQGEGVVGSYIHANGKIGAMVELRAKKPESGKKSEVRELAKDLCMQIAAVSPVCINPEDLPQDLLDKEKEIYMHQAEQEGKPEHIAAKIVEGRINKYYKEVCLIKQPFIKDDSKSIEDLLREVGQAVDDELDIGSFVRLGLGEEDS
ncbi:MAG: translation elongation factor Ts [Desulfonatronovibrionaceae bacterium]